MTLEVATREHTHDHVLLRKQIDCASLYQTVMMSIYAHLSKWQHFTVR